MAKSELVKITGQLGDIYTFYGTKFRKGDVLYVQIVEKS